jgi:hypothetical protein
MIPRLIRQRLIKHKQTHRSNPMKRFKPPSSLPSLRRRHLRLLPLIRCLVRRESCRRTIQPLVVAANAPVFAAQKRIVQSNEVHWEFRGWSLEGAFNQKNLGFLAEVFD